MSAMKNLATEIELAADDPNFDPHAYPPPTGEPYSGPVDANVGAR